MDEYKMLRQELFDVRMKLEILKLLKNKEDKPLYSEQIMKLRKELENIRTKIKKYKLRQLEKEGIIK